MYVLYVIALGKDSGTLLKWTRRDHDPADRTKVLNLKRYGSHV